jgi:hypothetical protein
VPDRRATGFRGGGGGARTGFRRAGRLWPARVSGLRRINMIYDVICDMAFGLEKPLKGLKGISPPARVSGPRAFGLEKPYIIIYHKYDI